MGPGDVIAAKYRIERVLGQGGMGIVFAARHLGLRERVAIKMLAPELATHGIVVARFLREARAAAALKGDHVVRVVDVDAFEGKPYLVMEHLDGESLGDTLEREGSLPVDVAVDYMLQACEALAEAHRIGIVHRDIKPGNLFLARRPDGSKMLKVLDFGISKFDPVEQGEPTLTDTSHPLGTPLYMSPEQLASAAHVDVRTDIWALGVVTYECVVGRRPFRSVVETLHAQPSEDGLTPELTPVILRALAKQSEERYTTVLAFAEALAGVTHADRTAIDRIARILSHDGETTLVDVVALDQTDRDPDPALAETNPATTRPLARREVPLPDTLGATSSSEPTIPFALSTKRRARQVFVITAALMVATTVLTVFWLWPARHQTTLESAQPPVVPAAPPAASTTAPTPSIAPPPVASTSATSSISVGVPPKKYAAPKPKPAPALSTPKTKSNEDI